MPRRPRLHVANGCYHVVLRGNRGQDVFFRPADRSLLEEFIGDAAERTRARIHAYCWLNDSIHLLAQVADIPLGRFVQRIGTRYARAVQQRAQIHGRLFEARYDSRLVDVDSYFLELLRDIHLQPVRAGIVARPEKYPWTSHRAYLSTATHPWLKTELALRLLHWQPERARTLYKEYISEGIGAPSDPSLYVGHRNDPRVLGDDQFLSTVHWQPAGQEAALDQAEEAGVALGRIAEETCLALGITQEALRSVRQNRVLSRARGLITARALESCVASLSEIARFLNRSPSAVSRAADRYGR